MNTSSYRKLCFVLAVLSLLFFFNPSHSQTIRVLFLGNSYTASNNLPALIASLASAGGDSLIHERNTPGGYTLGHPTNGHLYNATSLSLINEGCWDFVVLQEQSQYPTIPFYRDAYFYPGSYALDSLIHKANDCTETVFFMTWGRKNGGQQCIGSYCSPVFTDYEHMQDSLESAYLNAANEVDATISPVGIAWKNSILNGGDPIDLFSADQSHPSMAGSYLAACTFYAVFYNKSPYGLDYFGGLEEDDARYLQQVAEFTVMTDPSHWNIKVFFPEAGFDYEQIDDTVYFYDESVHAENYYWDFGDGTFDTLQNPAHHYTESGLYLVKQIVSNGCKVDSSSKLISFTLTGILQNNPISDIKVYPNPACKNIRIKTGLPPGSAYTINLFGPTGKVLQTTAGRISGEYLLIDLPELQNGMYNIQLIGNRKICGTVLIYSCE